MAVGKPGTFAKGKIKTVQYGPMMKEMGLLNVTNLPAKLTDGPSRMTDLSGGGTDVDKATLEYKLGNVDYGVTIKRLDGILTCEFCTPDSGGRVSWCSHLHHVLVNRSDTCFFSKPGRYVVPIKPSEGIYCPVHIGDPVANERNKSLPTVSPVEIILGLREKPGETRNIIIGYLRTSEIATTDLRNLFHDWALGNLADRTYYASTACQNVDHANLTKDSTLSEFASRFYPAMFGLCPPCIDMYQGSSDPVENPDEDAPKF